MEKAIYLLLNAVAMYIGVIKNDYPTLLSGTVGVVLTVIWAVKDSRKK